MRYTEHPLVKLIEECAEVQHRACKVMQFGPDEFNPLFGPEHSNVKLLRDEVKDLLATIVAVTEFGLMPGIPVEELAISIEEKKRKMQKYLDYSTQLGMMDGDSLPYVRIA